MARQSRSKGKTVRRRNRRWNGSGDKQDRGVVVDMQRFSEQQSQRSPTCRHPLVQARNQAQGQYLAAMRSNRLVFGLGPAGTGKTFCATAMAVEAFERGEVRRIIFTRPAIESGEHLGFLPGKLADKLEPYFAAFHDYLTDMLGQGVVDCAMKKGYIRYEPLAFMRGKTFDDAFIILDEAQNCTRLQLKMFMTRIGEQSRVVINGDTRQTDIGRSSGLLDAAQRLEGLDGVYVHSFECADIVRSGLVRNILSRYEPVNRQNGTPYGDTC